jgi:quinol monooxygenase YgiN
VQLEPRHAFSVYGDLNITDFGNFGPAQEKQVRDWSAHISVHRYTDMDAVKLHGSTDAFKGLMKTIEEEGLAAQPMRLQMLKPAGGYASRL